MTSTIAFRTCVGCRLRSPQSTLVRCVLGDDGHARIDRHGPGRGAWVCGSTCARRALARRGFERAWRRPVPVGAGEELIAALASTDGAHGGSRAISCETVAERG